MLLFYFLIVRLQIKSELIHHFYNFVQSLNKGQILFSVSFDIFFDGDGDENYVQLIIIVIISAVDPKTKKTAK